MRKFCASILALALFSGALFAFARPAQAASHPLPVTPQTVAAYATVIRHINPEMPKWQSRDFARRVIVNAERWRLDANILVAIVTVESHWHTHAVSRAGAIGLGQLMPGTASMLGVNPHNSGENLSGAACYLHGLMQRFGPNYDLVFAAYNAGPKAVEEFGGIPPYDETQHYVVKVMSAWRSLQQWVKLSPQAAELAAIPHGADVDYWLDGGQQQR
ncbi:MAG TPA: lytic transglycosylase domain-containing protein [Candidatus Baltobacteraceae bacterium]|nr:lytic transglycosylase domain-containing protein [Candidatus Baltobacteraceae bacterium]